ncbi:MAG: Sec-independent protein translocase protein TatB [Myxococcaceae bacterium]
MFNLGFAELAVILVVALVVLGPKRLPELARGLGRLLFEFRRQTDDVRTMVEREFYRMEATQVDKPQGGSLQNAPPQNVPLQSAPPQVPPPNVPVVQPQEAILATSALPSSSTPPEVVAEATASLPKGETS